MPPGLDMVVLHTQLMEKYCTDYWRHWKRYISKWRPVNAMDYTFQDNNMNILTAVNSKYSAGKLVCFFCIHFYFPAGLDLV
jgi:hypothetical protein